MKNKFTIYDAKNSILTWNLFLQGDFNAYTSIYNAFFKVLCNYGGKFTRDINIIEDSVHDIFVKLWTNKANLGTPVSVKNYLFKALRHSIFRKLQTNGRFEEIDGRDEYNFTFEVSFDHQLILDEEEKELQLKLKNVLQTLPVRQQEIIYLRFYEGLSYDEIADIMCINLNSTYKLFYKALNHFQENFKTSKVMTMLLLLAIIKDYKIF